MIIDQTIIDILRDRYRVLDIESRCESSYAHDSKGRSIGTIDSGGEINMRLTHSGFERLIRDLLDTKNMFSITPIETKDAGGTVYIAKYSIREFPLDVISAYAEKTREYFKAKGCEVIFMPKDIDISVMTVEDLTQMRDSLTELIQNLSYDNIIGF